MLTLNAVRDGSGGLVEPMGIMTKALVRFR